MKKILAIGDCNTLGSNELANDSYPERLGSYYKAEVINTGLTMSTSREGIELLKHHFDDDVDCVTIQFGLADSYKTFKYAPYIPYYPDNIVRKQIRRLVKKYKKISRRVGLSKRLGEVNVVPFEEYRDNYRKMIESTQGKLVILLETIPNQITWRNSEIVRYNGIIRQLAAEYPNCIFIELYDHFLKRFNDFYLDPTHSNEKGYNFIAEQICASIDSR